MNIKALSSLVLLAAMLILQACVPDVSAFADASDKGPKSGGTSEPAAIQCEFRARHRLGQDRLEAFISASDPTSGRFEIDLERKGTSGSSRVVQAGTFELAAGESKRIAGMAVGGAPGKVEAVLSVLTHTGRTVCEAKFPTGHGDEKPAKDKPEDMFET